MPTSDDGKEEHLYLLPPSNKLFQQKNSPSPIHETCYTTKDMNHVIGVHVDIQNPKTHYSISDSFMNQPVGSYVKKEVKSVDC